MELPWFSEVCCLRGLCSCCLCVCCVCACVHVAYVFVLRDLVNTVYGDFCLAPLVSHLCPKSGAQKCGTLRVLEYVIQSGSQKWDTSRQNRGRQKTGDS